MKINVFGRHFREGIKNIWRNGWMSFASISAVMITLLILGFSLVLALNAERMSTYVTGQLEISAYLDQSVSTAQGQQIEAEVAALPGVKSVDFVTKADGLQQLESTIPKEYKDLLAGFKENPLPIRLIIKANNPRDTVKIAQNVERVSGVARVKDGEQYLGRLFTTLDVLRNVGIAFVLALLVTAMFLISNTIKITIFSRRREIEIMKLVGATNWFIRWPFLVEGIIIGAIGALVPFLIITYSYRTLYEHMGGEFLGMSTLMNTVGISEKLAVVMFGIGIFIGIWGGIMSIRRFLKI